MPDFPQRTAPRRVPLGRTVAIGAALALTAGVVSSPSRADDLHNKQRQIQGHEQQAQQDLDGSSAAFSKAKSRLAKVSAELNAAKTRVTSVERSLRAAQANEVVWRKKLARSRVVLAKAQKELATAQKTLAAAQFQAQQYALSVMTGPSVQAQQLSALINASSISDVAKQMEYAQIYSTNQTSVIDTLTQAQAVSSARQLQVSDATAEVANGAAQAAAQVAAIKHLKAEAISARNQVWVLAHAAAEAAQVARKAQLRDQAALNALKAQEASIVARILAQSGSDLHRTGVITNGMLSYPLLGGGVLTSPYGYRINPIWGYWGLHDGDDFAAPCGTPEVAVQSGRVVSEYYSSVWGNRLFLDLGYIDGHNFTVIYNHMQAYAVGVGAVVTRGQTVGWEGTTGWSTGCHIHFTVMRDGVAVDPMQYIA